MQNNKSTLEFWMDDIDENLEEAKKKKKKPYSFCKTGMFDPEFEAKMFNRLHNTDGYMNGTIQPGQLDAAGHLVSGSSAGECSGEAAGGEGCCEGLTEDTAYVSRHESEYEFPPKVHLLPQKQVEKFILDLDVKENFRIGIITPLELYTAVSSYFDLFKATEMNGYTGIDYRDDTIDVNDEHQAERIAKARQQIADQDNLARNADGTLHGHQLDRDINFSTGYRAGGANKLGTNSVKANMYNDIELNRILFYIDPVNADIKNRYFARLYNANTNTWTDWFDADRDYMEKTVFNAIVAQAAYRQINMDEKDKKVLKKLQLTPEEFEEKYPGISVKDFVYCQQQGFDVFEWAKEHPFSRRWGIKELKAKLHKILFAEDEATITGSNVTNQVGLDRFADAAGQANYNKEKANVRALYTNQIYYISGRPGTFGKVLTESVKNSGQALTEAKRYVRRYYIRPQEIFCSNKNDIIRALINIDDANCSIYTLNNLGDVKDVTKLTNDDIIYYYDDGILYDKNHVKVFDYDLAIKHEEERDSVNANVASETTIKDVYYDRMTELTGDDLAENITNPLFFKVYCHTQKDTGKKYIGITSQKDINRWRSGLGYKNQPVFYRAIQKYGWDSFTHEIIADNLTEDEAKQLEQELIAKYHTYVNDPESMGYNASRGGEANLKYYTDEERKAAAKASHERSRERNGAKWAENAKKHYANNKDFYHLKNKLNYEKHKATFLAQEKEYQASLKAKLDIIRQLNAQFPDRLSNEDKQNIVNFRNCRNGEYIQTLLNYFSPEEIAAISHIAEESLEEEFNLSFVNMNAYGEILQEGKEHHICCICGEEFDGYGNNPSPVKEKGVCCDSCNMHFVIPARLEAEHDENNEQ